MPPFQEKLESLLVLFTPLFGLGCSAGLLGCSAGLLGCNVLLGWSDGLPPGVGPIVLELLWPLRCKPPTLIFGAPLLPLLLVRLLATLTFGCPLLLVRLLVCWFDES